MTWKLAGYDIDELVGFGASGQVWRARLVSSGEPVALKRVPIGSVRHVEAVRAEAALLSVLDHPNLIRLHQLIAEEDHVVLVLDLADGGSLADLIAKRGRLSGGEVSAALAPIGAALAYAHGEGVIHADVTPANVLFNRAGQPMLADLGVARFVGQDSPAHSTPAYIDPAVACGSVPGTQSDVFMLAATAVHALTGDPLWPGDSAAEVVVRASRGDLTQAWERLRDIPEPLAAVLAKALVLEPHLRASAAEFALDLRHCVAPVAIDLDAGRLGGPAPRAPSAPAADRPDDRPADPGRPEFERPAIVASQPNRPDAVRSSPAFTSSDVVSRDQLTHAVRASLRPALAASRDRVKWSALRPSRPRMLAAAMATLALIAAGVWWTMRPGDAAPSAAPSSTPVPTHVAPTASRVPALPVSPATAPPRLANVAFAALTALDSVRERAFASNDPSLLRAVYASADLANQDARVLAGLVPPACGLSGVKTTYHVEQVAGSDHRMRVTATARLPRTQLVCNGTPSGAVPGVPSTRLIIELVVVRGGYRIAEQHKAMS